MSGGGPGAGATPAPGSDPSEGERRWVGRLIVAIIVGPALLAALSILARWIW